MPDKTEVLTFSQAINQALSDAMFLNPKVVCFGLGATDPKRIFGTTTLLKEKFGKERVWDVPCSENGLTGVAIGMALMGHPTILTHQRVDFMLLSFDQLINNAAKWSFMFGQKIDLPLTIRAMIGQGWGQGPTHSQTLVSTLMTVPGLRVIAPSTPQDAYSSLFQAIQLPEPVIVLEHRWLHDSKGTVDSSLKLIPKTRKRRSGGSMTVVAYSYLINQCLLAANFLSQFGIELEIFDICDLNNIDFSLIASSTRETKNLLFVDMDNSKSSISNSFMTTVLAKVNNIDRWKIISYPNTPVPTSHLLAKHYYIDSYSIAQEVIELLGIDINEDELKPLISRFDDVPSDAFRGPF